jgi:YD repeat-containing protein
MPTTRRMAAAWVAAAIVTTCAPQCLHAAVGRTEGVGVVSPDGVATYSIPLRLPPGTNGMTPQLALVYDHRNTNTLLGIGWDLVGVSVIGRCASTWAQNGESREVRNDFSDRFCLQGSQLRLVSGTYGGNAAEYRTELESFARIRSYGDAGNGPAHFVVERRDGLIYEYGNTSDSRIESLGQSTARTWAVNKIRDRAGNAVVFGYIEDVTHGSFRISTIQYTSNPGQGLSPTYTVSFVYETKPMGEIDSQYLAGSLIKEVTRLDRIDVTHQGNLVRRYELSYESTLSSASKSRLATIQECAGPSLDCLAASTFSYQNGTMGLGAEVNTGAVVQMALLPQSIDVNGDGRDDLVYSSTLEFGAGHWMLMLANASGGYDAPANTGIVNHGTGALPIDYNADGREDLLVRYSGGTWWVMLGTGSALAAPVNTGVPASGGPVRALDVNGDGLQDLVWADLVGPAGGDAIRYRLREWGGTFASTVQTLVGPLPADSWIFSTYFAASTPRSKRMLDFNGDGRADLLYEQVDRVWEPETSQWLVTRNLNVICPGAPNFSTLIFGTDGQPSFGDFNGDGKDDLLYNDLNGTTWFYRLSNGTSFGSTLNLSGMSGFRSVDRLILDWDADGNDDVLVPQTSGGAWHLARSTGETLLTPVNLGLVLGGSTDFRIASDLNGDGLDDLSYSNGGSLRFRSHAGSYPDLLQTATDGFGNLVTFSYAPLTSGNYTKYADASFPEQDYAGPLQVVQMMTASDGVGGTYSLSHWYYGARRHMQGRGFEGFHARRTHDSRSGLYAYDYFHRLFPQTGAVFQNDLYQPNGSTLISRTMNTWAAHTYASGAEVRHLPYVSGSTASRYELGGNFNGSLISTTTIANTVDAATGALVDSTTTITEASTANGVQAGVAYVQRTYQPAADLATDWASWCIGRPGRIQSIQSHNHYGGSAITRTKEISWDTQACRPTEVMTEPADPQLQVTLTLGYDGYGNVSSETATGVGMRGRQTTTSWGTSGQFPIAIQNALGQITRLVWDATLGVQTSETDPNGISISWDYDAFGRRTREDRPDGTATSWSHEDCANFGCLNANAKTVVIETQHAGGTAITDRRLYADRFDRPIGSSARMLSGAYNRIEREYDALGRVARESAPCWWSACTPYWTSFTYDWLHRE